jgi:TRAP-type mannitol/chloroaromatic compound transport system substrate-binding protein
MAADYTNGNAMSLAQLQQDSAVEIRPFPEEVLRLLKTIAKDVVEEMMANDPVSAKVGRAYLDYMEKVAANSRLSEQAYFATRDY